MNEQSFCLFILGIKSYHLKIKSTYGRYHYWVKAGGKGSVWRVFWGRQLVRKPEKLWRQLYTRSPPCSPGVSGQGWGREREGCRQLPTGVPSGSSCSRCQRAASPGFRHRSEQGSHSCSKNAPRAYYVLGADRAGLRTDENHRRRPRPPQNLLYRFNEYSDKSAGICTIAIWVKRAQGS